MCHHVWYATGVVIRQTSLRRNARSSPDGLVDFFWRVSDAGHRVIEVNVRSVFWTNADAAEFPQGQRWAEERDYPIEENAAWTERVIARSRHLDGESLDEGRQYIPSAETYLAFVSGLPVDGSDGDFYTSFADTYGLLGRKIRFVVPGTDRITEGERVSYWDAERRAMASVIHAWRGSTNAEAPVPAWTSDSQRRDVQRTINERIGAIVGASARMLWDRDTERFALRLVPGTLIGAMWLSLAQAIDAGGSFHSCHTCQRYIVVHRARDYGRRRDAAYCSDACRQRAYRQRRDAQA